jgi:hypothetical protein
VSFDPITLAEDLNRSCHCVAVDRAKLERLLESGPSTAGVYASILRDQPHLFSNSPVFLARAHLEAMQQVIAAIESVIRSEPFRSSALGAAPAIAHKDWGPLGVFLGYDFHLGRSGPQLIEINTNAGGALLNAALVRAQQACCSEMESQLSGACGGDIEQRWIEMFREEWRRQRGDAQLRTIAIVDENPEKQYLYPEFLLFRELFERAGLTAHILDPRALRYAHGALTADGEGIDLVYNRLTDFFLSGDACAPLRDAYSAGDVVVTPNPRIYALYADKRHLIALSDPARLRNWGVSGDVIDCLSASIPETRLLDDRDRFWKERKSFFFKPVDGYGSKAAYRGDKLTRSVWEEMTARPYIAQRLVPPSQRTIKIDDVEVPLKLDLRNYVYDGRVQLVAARLYQGQTTNFRTAGGGFAGVLTEA